MIHLPHFRVLEVQAETLIFVKGTLSRDGHVLESLNINPHFLCMYALMVSKVFQRLFTSLYNN